MLPSKYSVLSRQEYWPQAEAAYTSAQELKPPSITIASGAADARPSCVAASAAMEVVGSVMARKTLSRRLSVPPCTCNCEPSDGTTSAMMLLGSSPSSKMTAEWPPELLAGASLSGLIISIVVSVLIVIIIIAAVARGGGGLKYGGLSKEFLN